MVQRIHPFSNELRQTVSYSQDYDVLDVNYYETYDLSVLPEIPWELPAKIINIISVILNGVFIASDEFFNFNEKTRKLTLFKMHIGENDHAYILTNERTVSEKLDYKFLINNFPSYNLYTDNGTSLLTITDSNYKDYLDNEVIDFFGLIINGIFYGSDNVTYDSSTKQFNIDCLEVIKTDEITICLLCKQNEEEKEEVSNG